MSRGRLHEVADVGAVARYSARPISREVAELGEGPRWDADRGELLWVDILSGVLRRAVPQASGELRTLATVRIPVPLGAAAPHVDGGWLLAAGTGVSLLSATGTVVAVLDLDPGAGATVRVNDAIADAAGRFFVGTTRYATTPGAARLYRCDLDGTSRVVLEGLTISNGMGWSPDGRTFYLADSGPATVTAYPFDPRTGDLGAGRTLLHYDDGVPDGLCVDDEGALWVAGWGTAQVRRHAPDGTLLAVVDLPVSQPSSVALGGSQGRTLFVTTAYEGMSAHQRSREPDAGRVFAVPEVAVAGPPASLARVAAAPGTSGNGSRDGNGSTERE